MEHKFYVHWIGINGVDDRYLCSLGYHKEVAAELNGGYVVEVVE